MRINEPLVSSKELVKKFGLSPSWIRRHLSTIPHFKIKGLLRFDPAEFKIWLKQFKKEVYRE